MKGSNLIKVFESAFSDELCDRLVDLYRTHSEVVEQGVTMEGDSKGKQSHDLFLHRVDDGPLMLNVINQFDLLRERYQLEFPFMGHSTSFEWQPEVPKMKRYEQGVGNYMTHVDVEPSHHQRQLVLIAYLNDVDIGGETVFPYQQVSVKPKKGDVLVFPPFWTFPHMAEKPSSGDKYIVSTFFRGV